MSRYLALTGTSAIRCRTETASCVTWLVHCPIKIKHQQHWTIQYKVQLFYLCWQIIEFARHNITYWTHHLK